MSGAAEAEDVARVAEEVLSIGDGLEEGAVRGLVERAGRAYRDRFEPGIIHEHLTGVLRLSAANPVEVVIGRAAGGRVSCTVIAFDHPFEFSLITGVLAGTGFVIESGDVFTLGPVAAEGVRRASATGWRRRWVAGRPTAANDPMSHGVIVDHFVGRLETDIAFESWCRLVRDEMIAVLGLVNQRDETTAGKAKRRVNQLVTQRLSSRSRQAGSPAPPPYLAPVEIDVQPVEDGQTRIIVTGEDTAAFLYSLATALSLQGLSIERVRIRSRGDRVEDVLDVSNERGAASQADALGRIRVVTLITKQFTYFLDRSPDALKALERFEQLVEEILRHEQAGRWMDLLRDPRIMEDLAKLLGASDFLWEDFIRSRADVLLSIMRPESIDRRFCPPSETLPLRMQEAIEGAVGLEEQCDRLNRLKDEEIFLIDLDHILVPGSDFRQLSERLTRLAETLVASAASVVYADLVRSYGRPVDEEGKEVAYAVFGLGKLGGVALGYASDIELMFLYRGAGHTSGGKRTGITCEEFFKLLARETRRFIRTKREGIFEVDLRLRPYGNEGPLAVSFGQFRSYYGPDGRAHAFERLALVRLRWIAGDAAFGYRVEQDRDRFVYDEGRIDLDALWEVWQKQHEQKEEPGRLNAKYSPGGLSDLETAVMLLQVKHAGGVPQLRSPRLSVVITSLGRAGILDAREYAELFGAYNFLRRVINALRMVRGTARDLFLPARGSDELLHLARRMGYDPREGGAAEEQVPRAFEEATAAVRGFIRRHFGRDCPGAA